MTPLSLQTTDPPAWLHSEFAPRALHCPPNGTVFCARVAPGKPARTSVARNPAAKPCATRLREAPNAATRARSSKRALSMLAYFSSGPPEPANPNPFLNVRIDRNAPRGFRSATRNEASCPHARATARCSASVNAGWGGWVSTRHEVADAIIGPLSKRCQQVTCATLTRSIVTFLRKVMRPGTGSKPRHNPLAGVGDFGFVKLGALQTKPRSELCDQLIDDLGAG